MPTTKPAPTTRGQARRERILEAAAQLVAARGFHSVGVSDIGAAAGVSGAALYRHFANKTDLLAALFDRFVDELLDHARDAVAAHVDPPTTLQMLIGSHIDVALRDRAVLAVYGQEAHNLPDDDRRRLRRKQRQYVEIWRGLLRDIHPAITDSQALLWVEAVFGLLNSVPNLSRTFSDAELRRELASRALAALAAE